MRKIIHKFIRCEQNQDKRFILILGMGLLFFNLFAVTILNIPVIEAIENYSINLEHEKLKNHYVVTVRDEVSVNDKLSNGG